MVSHQFGEIGTVHTPRHVVPGGNRQEGAGIVVKAGGIVKTSCFCALLAKPAHTLRAVMEPPGGAQFQAGVVTGQRRKLAAVNSLIKGKKDNAQFWTVAMFIQQGF